MALGGCTLLTNIYGRHGGIGVRPTWATARVRAMFSCRHGDSLASSDLDVGFHGRVSTEDAISHRQQISKELGVPLDQFVFVRQVHGANIFDATAEHRGLGSRNASDPRPEADAIVTNVPGVALAILVADCVPVLFFDPVVGVIAAAHSGWRGTVSGISGRVIEHMVERYGSQPRDIRVSIGPSMRQCCYEVDDRVAEHVVGGPFEAALRARFRRVGKYMFSMPDAIRIDLLRQGVDVQHIEDTGLCTSCRANHFFSHRREAGNAGRQIGVISLT